jgi:hypothetical protein
MYTEGEAVIHRKWTHVDILRESGKAPTIIPYSLTQILYGYEKSPSLSSNFVLGERDPGTRQYEMCRH